MKGREPTRVRMPEVKVKLTEEEKLALSDWQEQVALFQRNCDERAKNMEKRFRLCLHEGGHAVQYGEFDWNVLFHGPYVEQRDGKLEFVAGAVSPIPYNDYQPLPWQRALVSISGFKLVEHFTGVPDDDAIIENDLASVYSKV